MRNLGKAAQALLCWLFCFLSTTAVLASQARSPAPRDVEGGAKFIADELRHCPVWIEVPPQDKHRRQQITDIYLKLARYPTNVIRAGVYTYVMSYAPSDPRSMEAGYKVFALERVLFKVPRRFRVGERIPYAIVGNPLIHDGAATYVNFLWPYSVGSAGRLVLTGSGVGQASGPPYNPLRDFDEMAGRLARRRLEVPARARP